MNTETEYKDEMEPENICFFSFTLQFLPSQFNDILYLVQFVVTSNELICIKLPFSEITTRCIAIMDAKLNDLLMY